MNQPLPQPTSQALSRHLPDVLLACASVLLAMLIYQQPGAPLSPGLDSSWAYGLNYAFQQNLVMGRDILFTFGPLGFLDHTRGLTPGMLDFSGLFWFACPVLTAFVLLQLARVTALSRWHLLANLILATVLLVHLHANIDRLLVLVYAGVFLHWRHRHPLMLPLLAFASVLALLIKFSYGVVALALLLPYVLAIALRSMALGDREWQSAITGLLCLPLSLVLVWLAVYGHLQGMAGYLHAGVEFSRGSTSAMALNPENHWPAIIFFYSSVLFGLWLIGRDYRHSRIWMPLCFIGPLFIWTKYAFGREDIAHLASLMTFVFQLGLISAIAATTWEHKASCLLAILLSFITWRDMHTPAIGEPEFASRSTLSQHDPLRLPMAGSQFMPILAERSTIELQPLLLPPALRAEIGDNRVDIYPWETLIAAANQLNWSPRPTFQSYISYNPFLDRNNAEFLSGADAPAFILWHYHSFADIDNRYPFSSDPLTLQAILQHYRQLRCEGVFCLWQRAGQQQLDVQDSIAATSAAWNTWIPVPQHTADVQRLHVDARRTLAGQLNLLLWKEGGVEIDYRLRDGQVRTHTVVLDNASSGLWVSPYIRPSAAAQHPVPLDRRILDSWLAAAPAKGHLEGATQVAGTLQVWGWGLASLLPTQQHRIDLLLFNETHAYRATILPRHRAGISQYFGVNGQVDLDQCGIQETIKIHDMAPGTYQLRFTVENAGQRAISPAQALTVTVDNHLDPHNVEAVRLRTIRPWAFADTLNVRWSTLTFRDGHPW